MAAVSIFERIFAQHSYLSLSVFLHQPLTPECR
jgi:hypothetical protein